MAHVRKNVRQPPRFLLRGCRSFAFAGGSRFRRDGDRARGVATHHGLVELKCRSKGKEDAMNKRQAGKLRSEGHWPAEESTTARQINAEPWRGRCGAW